MQSPEPSANFTTSRSRSGSRYTLRIQGPRKNSAKFPRLKDFGAGTRPFFPGAWGGAAGSVMRVLTASCRPGLKFRQRPVLQSYRPGLKFRPRPVLERILGQGFPGCCGFGLFDSQYHFAKQSKVYEQKILATSIKNRHLIKLLQSKNTYSNIYHSQTRNYILITN